jgi:ABC-type dipeptide/oligopeptide/nickel transport system permease subunit
VTTPNADPQLHLTRGVDEISDTSEAQFDTTGDLESASPAAAVAAYGTAVPTGQWRDIWKRFVRNPLSVAGLIIIIGLVVIAIFAPLIAPDDPDKQDLGRIDPVKGFIAGTFQSPSGAHWFGTDDVGRDVFSRVLYGSRIALEVGLATILLAVFIGVVLGSVAGFFGRGWDALIMRIADIFFAFPLLVGAVLIITVVGQGILPVIIALGLFGWATIARLLRGSILSVRETEYVEAARSLGASRWRIVTRHVLPNSYAPVLIYATFSVGSAVVAEAALSYLGVGVKPGVAEWGSMIASGQVHFQEHPGLVMFPSLAVVLTVLAFVFVGDGLRDALDPKLR